MALDRRSFLKVTTAAAGALALDALPLEGALCKSSLSGAGKGISDDLVMRGVLVREFGPPEVLRIEEVPRPVPTDGEILVKVQAAAVNPVDAIVRTGGWNIPTPLIPGFDLSGVVAALGPGVTDYRIGDEVFALLDLQRGGAYAEYAVVRVDEAARKPGRTSHAGAASLPLVALTSWQALFDTAGLRTGQSILIHAGAGGVGSTAIQLAKWRGATVYATASEANHAYMRGLGADVTIDYRTERFEDIAKDVDVVLDPIAGSTQVRSLDVLREGGILVSLNGLTGPARNPPRNVRAEAILVRPDSDQLNQVAQLVDGGFLRPTVSHLLPLERAADAHTQIETGRTRGKIVLQVEWDPDGVGRGRDRGLLGTG